jgi:hypothetical protein
MLLVISIAKNGFYHLIFNILGFLALVQVFLFKHLLLSAAFGWS